MHGPYVVLSPIAKSHPFEERRAHVGPDEDPLKIGRAVARLKAAKDNAIFDCKVNLPFFTSLCLILIVSFSFLGAFTESCSALIP